MSLPARAYAGDDQAAVLSLIADDRLTGQPETTSAMLADALTGHSAPDGERRDELDPPHTEVVQDSAGQVLGVVTWATRPSDEAGFILWLHAGEDLAVAAALVEHALSRLGRRTVCAFELPTALSQGLRGLPVRSRPATRTALENAGFSPRCRWRYLHRILPHRSNLGDIRTYPIAEVAACDRPPGWQLRLREPDGTLIGEATVGRPVDGIGVLRWIDIDPQHRGRGLGADLAEQCCNTLAANGAHEVIALVDEDVPSGDREFDRAAAAHLLDARGFQDIGQLWSFSRRP